MTEQNKFMLFFKIISIYQREREREEEAGSMEGA